MATASEHADIVLSAIIPDRRDLLEKAQRRISENHFPEQLQVSFFLMLSRYSDHTGGAILPRHYLDDALSDRAGGAQALLYMEAYDKYAETSIPDSDFAWSLEQLRELAAAKATGDALTESMEILRTGKTLGQETLQGHHDARGRILESFQAIDRELNMQDAPEGDMREEGSDMLADYAERKLLREQGLSDGIMFGIPSIDQKVGGMQAGELILTAAYSSHGKTTLATQTAWHAAVEQGKNVVFLTTETLRPQVRRKILARHSKQPQFELPEGLNTRDLKAGTLSDTLETKLQEVVSDLTRNPAYGRIYIAQVSRSATIASIEQLLYRIQRKFNIDFVVMDYLALLMSDRRRQTNREELSNIVKEAKLLAVSFDDARGIPFMSPWQMSRAALDSAQTLGMYTGNHLSETAEAMNSADIVISLLAPIDNSDRETDVMMQVLKNRDGETANEITVRVDYATSHFYSRRMDFVTATQNSADPFGTAGGFSASMLLN